MDCVLEGHLEVVNALLSTDGTVLRILLNAPHPTDLSAKHFTTIGNCCEMFSNFIDYIDAGHEDTIYLYLGT